MQTDNVQMLADILSVCEQSFYMRGGKLVDPKLSPDEMYLGTSVPDERSSKRSFDIVPC